MYDEQGSGYVDLESFRVMVESFGIQACGNAILGLSL